MLQLCYHLIIAQPQAGSGWLGADFSEANKITANGRVTNDIWSNLRTRFCHEGSRPCHRPLQRLACHKTTHSGIVFISSLVTNFSFTFDCMRNTASKEKPFGQCLLIVEGMEEEFRTTKVCVAIKQHENAQSLLLLIGKFRWKTTRNWATRFMANMNQLTKRTIAVECKCPATEKNRKFNDACRPREARQKNERFTSSVMQERKSNSNVVSYSTLAGKMIFFCFNLRRRKLTFLRRTQSTLCITELWIWFRLE